MANPDGKPEGSGTEKTEPTHNNGLFCFTQLTAASSCNIAGSADLSIGMSGFRNSTQRGFGSSFSFIAVYLDCDLSFFHCWGSPAHLFI